MAPRHSITLHVRLDPRDLATILRFYKQRGIILRTRASLVKESVETLSSSIISSMGAEPFESSADAISYLNTHLEGAVEVSRRKIIEQLSIEGLSTPEGPLEDSEKERMKSMLEEMKDA